VVFRFAVIVTTVGAFTAEVMIWKFTLVKPAGTTTGDGKVTSGLLLVTLTGWPGLKAGAEMVTVPRAADPLGTVPELTVSAVTLMGVTGVTVSVACTVVRKLVSDAMMLITCVEPTWLLVIWKVVEVLPEGTTTVAGTITTRLLATSATLVPPAGAAIVKVTVAVEFMPPGMVSGLSVIVERLGELDGGVVWFGLLPHPPRPPRRMTPSIQTPVARRIHAPCAHFNQTFEFYLLGCAGPSRSCSLAAQQWQASQPRAMNFLLFACRQL